MLFFINVYFSCRPSVLFSPFCSYDSNHSTCESRWREMGFSDFVYYKKNTLTLLFLSKFLKLRESQRIKRKATESGGIKTSKQKGFFFFLFLLLCLMKSMMYDLKQEYMFTVDWRYKVKFIPLFDWLDTHGEWRIDTCIYCILQGASQFMRNKLKFKYVSVKDQFL